MGQQILFLGMWCTGGFMKGISRLCRQELKAVSIHKNMPITKFHYNGSIYLQKL
jgi:hypothetical protein